MMATTILIATVGESCAPVVRAVLDHHPDRVYFICSAGPKGTRRLIDTPGDHICGDEHRCPKCNAALSDTRGPSIAQQAGLATGSYETIEVDDPDDVPGCLAAVHEAYRRAFAADPETRILADYTGGTKTMTAALMRLATGRYAASSRLSLVKVQRNGSKAVLEGTEGAWLQETRDLLFDEQWHAALALANGYHYASADTLLTALKQQALPKAMITPLQALSTICRGLDAWDCFDHPEAYRLLVGQGRAMATLLPTLRELRRAAESRSEGSAPGWDLAGILPVYDLLLNADRRAAQGRYDDAVARHYRAIELLAQTRLRAAHGIDASDVDAEKVAAWLAASPERASRGKIQTGLTEDYAILASLGDPLGVLWAAEEKRLRAGIQRRNASVLAHGLEPIRKDEYPALRDPVWAFVDAALQATGVPMRQAPAQFPHIAAEHLSG